MVCGISITSCRTYQESDLAQGIAQVIVCLCQTQVTEEIIGRGVGQVVSINIKSHEHG